MNINELIDNQFYYSSHTKGWILKFSHVEGVNRIMSHMCMPIERGMIFNNRSAPKGWGQWDNLNKDLRLATPEEVKWLLAAIKEGRWIPKPEKVEDYYEIC